MFPADFRYVRAASLADALGLLAAARDGGEEVKLLAGGQSLLPMMKLRLAVPEALVDIGGVAEIRGVTADGDAIRIGALTTYRDLARDPLIARACPAVTDALAVLADPQVRARGTVGGCVAHGDPASDLPAVLLATDAQVAIAGPAGTRAVALDDFLLGVFDTDLAPDEIVTTLLIPGGQPPGDPPAGGDDPSPLGQTAQKPGGLPDATGWGSAYEKFPHPASHLPLAGVCARARVKDGVITSARVAVTGAAPRVFRAIDMERTLVTRPVPEALAAVADEDAAARDIASSLAASGREPLSDQHASGPFRLHLAGVLARRALARAIERAQEER